MTVHPLREFVEQSRREFLTTTASGLGGLALAALLAQDGVAMGPQRQDPLAPKPPHFSPRARNCIFFFFAGGTSQLDLYDPKPKVNQLSGQHVPRELTKGVRFAFIQKDSAVLMGSPFRFARHGQSGMEFSELLPNLAGCADQIAMIRSMHTEPFNHHPAQTMMNTGFERMGRPSVGSWITYGLGSQSADLPGYVVLEPGPGARGGPSNWSSGFMPTSYQGVLFHNQGDPVRNLSNPAGVSPTVQRRMLDAIAKLNERRRRRIRDPEIASRLASYELAFRMQSAAPELIGLEGETTATRQAYGVDRKDDLQRRFSTSCLLARRLVERGVRFVNIYMAGWDQHTGLDGGLRTNCAVVDRPLAALLNDLKQRGLLDETLVVWGTEFGRTSLGDNRQGRAEVTGRDHQPSAFTVWMAGGGTRGGTVYGETDELGWNVARDGVHVNDLHATLLHLFGLDHEALTYRFQGRDFRLTDVAGRVVHDLIA